MYSFMYATSLSFYEKNKNRIPKAKNKNKIETSLKTNGKTFRKKITKNYASPKPARTQTSVSTELIITCANEKLNVYS